MKVSKPMGSDILLPQGEDLSQETPMPEKELQLEKPSEMTNSVNHYDSVKPECHSEVSDQNPYKCLQFKETFSPAIPGKQSVPVGATSEANEINIKPGEDSELEAITVDTVSSAGAHNVEVSSA